MDFSFPMKCLIAALLIILLGLQYALWFSPHGIKEYFMLKKTIQAQLQENQQLITRNQQLAIDIQHLKYGTETIEEHARNDLGMIKSDETFYQIIDKS